MARTLTLRTPMTWFAACFGPAVVAPVLAFWQVHEWRWPVGLLVSASVLVCIGAVILSALTLEVSARGVRHRGVSRRPDQSWHSVQRAWIARQSPGRTSADDGHDEVWLLVWLDGPSRGMTNSPIGLWTSMTPDRLADSDTARSERSRARVRDLVALLEDTGHAVTLQLDLIDHRAMLRILGRADPTDV